MSSKFSRRHFLRVVSLGSGMTLLAACAPETVEKIVKETVVVEKVVEKEVTAVPESKQELEGDITIQWWGDVEAVKEDPLEGPTWGALYLLVKDWEARHPKVNIEWYSVPSGTDVYDVTRTALIAGTAPDLVGIYAVTKFIEGNLDLMYNLADDMKKPNPYGTEATWADEFFVDPNAFALAEQNGGLIPRGEIYFMGSTTTTNMGQVVCYYNVDAFEEAGVEGRIETWKDMTDACEKLQAAGWETPLYIAGKWMLANWFTTWNMEQLLDPIIQEVIDAFGKDQMGWDTEMQAWAIKNGVFRADDPRYLELAKVIKDTMPYANKDWAAVEDVNYFLTKRCAIFPDGFWSLRNMRDAEERDFRFGSFGFPPKITKETSDFATGASVRRHGGLEGGEISNSLMVPMSTVENGTLPIVLDLLQYITSRPSNNYWCELQYPPCIPRGKTLEEVFDDPEEVNQLYGFFNPPMTADHGIRSVSPGGPAYDVWGRLLEQYLLDEITLEELGAQLQTEWERQVEKEIVEHPNWDTDNWPSR